jgi:pseudaminic acid cytidylyltransferase
MNVAIIPARGGSKRIPRKNIKDFCGKPMLAYAITTARQSGLFDHVVVSTDDDEIAHIAHSWGADIPLERPAELAGDNIATAPVIAHAIQALGKLGWTFDHVCCIYPCVPLLSSEDLSGALSHLQDSQADYCFPVTEYPSAIERAMRISESGRMQPFFPEFELVRTQDMEAAYYDAGQFYWGSSQAWLSNPKIHSNGSGFVIPNWRVIDIDTPDDWKRAELMHRVINPSKASA